jgi:hypothetical protein
MTFDPHAYTIRIRKIAESGGTAFEATVAELPYVSGHGKSANAAYADVIDLIDGLKESATANGQPFPTPVAADEDVSGRVTLRMSKSLHRAVITGANAEGVSLNSYLCEVLSSKLYEVSAKAASHTTDTANVTIGISKTAAAVRRVTARGFSTSDYIAGFEQRQKLLLISLSGGESDTTEEFGASEFLKTGYYQGKQRRA